MLPSGGFGTTWTKVRFFGCERQSIRFCELLDKIFVGVGVLANTVIEVSDQNFWIMSHHVEHGNRIDATRNC